MATSDGGNSKSIEIGEVQGTFGGLFIAVMNFEENCLSSQLANKCPTYL